MYVWEADRSDAKVTSQAYTTDGKLADCIHVQIELDSLHRGFWEEQRDSQESKDVGDVVESTG